MKPILKDFSEIQIQLAEFPEFFTLAESAGLKDFTEAVYVYRHQTLYSDQLKQVLARFILWLALATVGEFRVVVGKKYKYFNVYYLMRLYVSPFEVYRQAKEYYAAALRIKNKNRT